MKSQARADEKVIKTPLADILMMARCAVIQWPFGTLGEEAEMRSRNAKAVRLRQVGNGVWSR